MIMQMLGVRMVPRARIRVIAFPGWYSTAPEMAFRAGEMALRARAGRSDRAEMPAA